MPAITPEMQRMSASERKSLTHGEFWIPEKEREVYREALETLNRAGVPYVVSGLYAIHAYTGIYRETKDLDLLMEPDLVVPAAEALREAGFHVKLEEPHWIAKALKGAQVDLIYGMSNGVGFIDRAWYENSRPAILAATPVRIAPPEELIWHRLYIGERHRFDMADVVHLILHRGHELDWDRLLERVGGNWRLLASQLHFFDFAYPEHEDRVPRWVRERLLAHTADAVASAAPGSPSPAGERGRDGPVDGAGAGAGAVDEVDEVENAGRPDDAGPLCRGTMLSRFSFAIDVNEWGFRDERLQHVAAVRSAPVVDRIRDADVWETGAPTEPDVEASTANGAPADA